MLSTVVFWVLLLLFLDIKNQLSAATTAIVTRAATTETIIIIFLLDFLGSNGSGFDGETLEDAASGAGSCTGAILGSGVAVGSITGTDAVAGACSGAVGLVAGVA